ncbi:aquaporin-1 [Nannizzia gypsea CBS 118893]|uniref:Aquaporin-1 n=1 Tax=Arthroderma gypseum (strain ATCC MYA-4604 / CBS 118893) TaxID=535722 RepID=E4URU3_ARTGP|nr:aquaporin-1 [Nannizzia gypsea CBS 118893]EFR01215.1 aquaporin-1 [Nannizzia gypsea CBS 118893]
MGPLPSLFTSESNDSFKKSSVATLGEFVGTFMFLFLSYAGCQIANMSVDPQNAGPEPNPTVLIYISLSFATALAINVWVFYRITGGMFNPAVSLALALVGAISPIRAVMVSVAQVVAGIAAAGVVSALFPGPLVVQTKLSGGTTVAQGLFIEMFLTAELIITILMLAVVKHRATFLAPLGIGLALFIAQLTGVYFTGGSLNPARSFGPDVIVGGFPGYHWIYWVGPLLGSLLATGFYQALNYLRYQNVNPGQDFDGIGSELMGNPEHTE